MRRVSTPASRIILHLYRNVPGAFKTITTTTTQEQPPPIVRNVVQQQVAEKDALQEQVTVITRPIVKSSGTTIRQTQYHITHYAVSFTCDYLRLIINVPKLLTCF